VATAFTSGAVRLGGRSSITVKVIVKVAVQASEGVRSLHQENIIHRDLACRNLLVDENP
jgi:serine/threonine protein kinase